MGPGTIVFRVTGHQSQQPQGSSQVCSVIFSPQMPGPSPKEARMGTSLERIFVLENVFRNLLLMRGKERELYRGKG